MGRVKEKLKPASAPPRRVVEVREIVQGLSMASRDVCKILFPEGRHGKTRCQVGSLAGEPGQSLSVHFDGRKPGNWRDFASGERGDILDLVSHTLFNGHKPQAVEWAKRYLGIVDADPDELETFRREAERKALAQTKKAEAEARDKRGRAWRIWGIEAEADIRGTPAEIYLNGRGIDLDQLGSLGALRYHPECLVSETGELLPALVAAIVRPDGKFAAVHRTFLEPDGLGGFVKADMKEPKRSLGEYLGGHISIAKGPSGVSLRRAPEGDAALLIEGIEDGCTMAMACPDMRVVVCVSVANMASVVMPDRVRTRFLVKDNDWKPQAIEAFNRVKELQCRVCNDVRVVEIDGAKDPNALLMGEGT